MSSASKWLLCDYGNVLALPPTPYDNAAIIKLSGVSKEKIRETHWTNKPGTNRDSSAHDYWKSLVDDESLVDEILRLEIASYSRPSPEAVSAVKRAASRGFRLAVFSNAPVEFEQALENLDWLSPFERIFVSTQVGAKPDPESFKKVLAELGAEPTDVIFVDDRKDNVEGARSVGIRSIHYTDPSQIDELG